MWRRMGYLNALTSDALKCLAALFVCLIGAVQAELITPGSEQKYNLINTVTIHELQPHSDVAAETSYTFESLLIISSVWSSTEEQLLQVDFTETSVSAPSKTGSRQVKQQIDKISDRPFYISLVHGKPSQVIAHTSRDQSALNLKRSIASLLQLQYTDGKVKEVDVSGQCDVLYQVLTSTHIRKTKTDCSNWDLRVTYRPEKSLSIQQLSNEQLNFELSENGLLTKVESIESHRIALEGKRDAGGLLHSKLLLSHAGIGDQTVKQLRYPSLAEAVKSLLEWYRVFDIDADMDGAVSDIKGATLAAEVAKRTSKLGSDQIGRQAVALSLAELVPHARIAKQEEFVEILQQHKQFQTQLVDLLGSVQTIEAHNAIRQVFNYDELSNRDLVEKYLQSLSLGTHPERAIIEDLFEQLTNDSIKDEKLHDTTVQTVAAITRQSTFDANDPLLHRVRTFILDNLETKCDSKTCKVMYIRALQNLRDPFVISVLTTNAVEGDSVISVASMQALKSFPVVNFSEEHRKVFSQIFYQRKRKYDTSSRTAALDILLALKPTKLQLDNLLTYLGSNDRQFEVKTYVWQTLRMLSEKCPRFRALLSSCLHAKSNINNYHILAQKGMTTVLRRQLSNAPSFNESLLSIQEIYKGVLKRGTVEFLLHAGREETSSFKLGLYTSGLDSFVGDGEESDNDENADDKPVTAGMEISLQGTSFRPLVFFNGQTELMGHVWSGTASDSTPAYQATTLTYDHEQYIILASGTTVHTRIVGTKSIDLSGRVEVSVWNRNANTEIVQNSANGIHGVIVAGFTFAKLRTEFTLTDEPNLSLQASLDFYSGIKLCMQLQRPETILTHSHKKSVLLNAAKPYKKHVLRIEKYKSPGRTLALNQKNNEMCNIIFG